MLWIIQTNESWYIEIYMLVYKFGTWKHLIFASIIFMLWILFTNYILSTYMITRRVSHIINVNIYINYIVGKTYEINSIVDHHMMQSVMLHFLNKYLSVVLFMVSKVDWLIDYFKLRLLIWSQKCLCVRLEFNKIR